MKDDIRSLKKKYITELEKKLGKEVVDEPVKSRDYEYFRKSLISKKAGWYEKLCNQSEKLIKFKPSEKARVKLLSSIETAHLNVTPEGVYTASYLIPFILLLIALLGFVGVPYILGSTVSFFFLGVSMLLALIIVIPLQKYPNFLATSWRLKSSNQMVLCIFYLVTYMRQNANLERAVEFAADHLDPPLSLDLKKILWDLETERYDTLNDSLDNYLEGWKSYSEEFVDSLHLIQSSLLESSEARRLGLLDKSLDVMLEGTYEKMLHYAQNLKNPITTLHMLGVILPVLGLVILPLAVSFMEGITWIHLTVFYNIILPFFVYYLAKTILASRPSGYGDTDISETSKIIKKQEGVHIFGLRISPLYVALVVGVGLVLIGLLPIIIHHGGGQDFCWDFGNPNLFCTTEEAQAGDCYQTYCAWGYETIETSSGQIKQIGPFGFLASLFSIFIPLGLGLGLGLYFKLRADNVIKIRTESKKLEKEFSTALFQLGNRLGDGLPAEIAIPRVAEIMQGTLSGNFFARVSSNMQKLGMGLAPAIFDKKHGALIEFPSKVITSSMKVLVESMKKGPLIAAQAVNNVARYIKEIHRVNERLKDLLSDIISSMKQQINFLAPIISGVVVGITSMITFVLGKLRDQSEQLGTDLADAEALTTLLDLGSGIPTFYFQLVVGIYVVQIVYILTIMANSIENGEDKLGERYLLGKNLIRTTLLYVGIALAVLLVFQILAGEIISRTL